MRSFTEEHRRKISLAKMGNQARLGQKHAPETREKIRQSLLGHPVSEEQKEKQRRKMAGRKLSGEHTQKISEALKGRKVSPEHARKMRLAKKGKKNPMYGKCGADAGHWKGGIWVPRLQMNSAEYKAWRRTVLERDGHVCQKCGAPGNHAHHKKPWAKYKELRYDVDNGLTLCKSCHNAAHRKPQPPDPGNMKSQGGAPMVMGA